MEDKKRNVQTLKCPCSYEKEEQKQIAESCLVFIDQEENERQPFAGEYSLQKPTSVLCHSS